MIDKLTNFADYFRKVPAAFLVAIISVLCLILFIPEEVAKILAVDIFREKYRIFLGPAFLLTASFCIARIFVHFKRTADEKKKLKNRQKALHNLTPEEKGYLVQYIENGQNTIYVGIDDGVMGGLLAKGITYRASNVGDLLRGVAHNLQPWAKEYLEKNPELLNGYAGRPMTPRERLHAGW